MECKEKEYYNHRGHPKDNPEESTLLFKTWTGLGLTNLWHHRKVMAGGNPVYGITWTKDVLVSYPRGFLKIRFISWNMDGLLWK